MRAVRSQRPRTSGRVASHLLLVVILSSCATPAARGPSASPAINGNAIVAQVASYQHVVNQPGRLLIALMAADNRWLSFGSVELSFTYLGTRAASPPPDVKMADTTATYLPIPGSPEANGRAPSLTFPADGRGVYAVEPITFPRAGYWELVAQGELGDGSQFRTDAAFTVLDTPSVIGVGAVAPRTANPLIGDAGVPPAAIDSRAAGGEPIPDPELHATSIADAIAAGRPALVVFSTPVYCVSQFCGPITDLVAELAGEYHDRADFIHVEIYRDFEAGKVNQAALDWLLTKDGDLREPWTFLIGADGKIAASWDTVVTRSEIEPLLKALPAK